MGYCKCCGQDLATTEQDGAWHSGFAVSEPRRAEPAGTMMNGSSWDQQVPMDSSTIAEGHANQSWQDTAQPHTHASHAPQPIPASLRWDAHLAEIFEEADRLRAQDGHAHETVHVLYLAYAMSRMISVAPYLADAGIDSRALRDALRAEIAAAARTPGQAIGGDRFDSLIASLHDEANARGARKVGIGHLIDAFGHVGIPLADVAGTRNRPPTHAQRDRSGAPTEVPAHVAAWEPEADRRAADRMPPDRIPSHPVGGGRVPDDRTQRPHPGSHRHATPQRQGGARRLFSDPRQLAFRGLTPTSKRAWTHGSAHRAKNTCGANETSACSQVAGDVAALRENTRSVGEVLSRLERQLGDFDRRLGDLERRQARADADRDRFDRDRFEKERTERDRNERERREKSQSAHTGGRTSTDGSALQSGRQSNGSRTDAGQTSQSSNSSQSSRSSAGSSTARRRATRAARGTGLSWSGVAAGRDPGRWHMRSLSSSGTRRTRASWSQRGERDPRESRDHHAERRADRPNDARDDSADRGKRFYLALDDDIVDAPAIGPKTADRLRPHGIRIVRDLLVADPATLASAVEARHITAALISDWQTQARLVITIPWLRGTHAQLLVGAGFEDANEIARTTDQELMSAILRYAATREGQRLLRDGPPPPREKIADWLAHARQAEPERAA